MTTTTATDTGFAEMGAAMEAAKEDAAPAPKYQVAISNESKATILCNIESGVKDLITSLAKKDKIEGVDINVEEYAHLPNSQTGVMMYFVAKGLETEFNIGFSQPPVSIARRGKAGAYEKKVEGKKRLLTRDQKNHIIEKMQMSFYEKDIIAGKINIEEAMTSIKAAFEEKAEFEKMGYMLPAAKTAYPFWENEGEEGKEEG